MYLSGTAVMHIVAAGLVGVVESRLSVRFEA